MSAANMLLVNLPKAINRDFIQYVFKDAITHQL